MLREGSLRGVGGVLGALTLLAGCAGPTMMDAGTPNGGDMGGVPDAGPPLPGLSSAVERWAGAADIAQLVADEDSIAWRTHAPFQVMVLDPGSQEPRVLDSFPNADSVHLVGMTYPYVVFWVDGALWSYDVRPEEIGRTVILGDYAIQSVDIEEGSVFALVSPTHYAQVRLADGMHEEHALPPAASNPSQIAVAGAFVAVMHVPMPDQDAWGVVVFERSTNEVVATDLQWQSGETYKISAIEEDATIFGENVVPHDGSPPYPHGQAVETGLAQEDTVRRGWRYRGYGRSPMRFPGRGQLLVSLDEFPVTHATDLVPDGVVWAMQSARIQDEHGDELDEPVPFGPVRLMLILDVRGEQCTDDDSCFGESVSCTAGLCTMSP